MAKWKQALASVAPALATAIGGPLAGTATKFLSGALLGKSGATEKELETAILSASPGDLAKIREIDNKFKIEMERVGVDLEKLGVDDRKSARDLAKTTGTSPQVWLSAIFIGGYFYILWIMLSGVMSLDDETKGIAQVLLGVLTTGIPMILRFWFGGSPQDNENMNRIYNSIPKR